MAKLLFVIHGLEFGGGERVFLQLITGLRSRFDIVVAAMAGGIFEKLVKELGVSFYPLTMNRQVSILPIYEIIKIAKNHKVEIIHSQGARADFYARIASRIAGVPVNLSTVAMPVEGFDVEPLRKKIYRAFDRFSEQYVDRFIVVSEILKKTLIEERAIPAGKVARIYNGIELDHYYPAADNGKTRKELGIPKDVPLIGAIGRMVWQKGFDFLIKAIPKVVQVSHKAKFLLVGDGPLKKELEARSKAMGIADKVIFTGYRSDIKDILSSVDLLVVSSLLEGFPMITLEAMAMAKPIIATNIDGINEQITDGKNGILVPKEDSTAISRAILKLIQDKNLSNQLALSARKRIEKEFSVEKMVAETEKVYLTLLEANSG